MSQVVDDHFSVRRHISALRGDLGNRTHQYRVVQKRLLMRFKDRSNPGSLGHLDDLLTLTYETIMQIADTIQEAERALKVVSQHLQACTKLILLLIQYRFDLDQQNSDLLGGYFAFASDDVDQGWEEVAAVFAFLSVICRRNLWIGGALSGVHCKQCRHIIRVSSGFAILSTFEIVRFAISHLNIFSKLLW